MATEEKKEEQKFAESHTFLCIMCKHKDKHMKPDLFCVECNDHYCLSCVKVHEDVPFLFGHTIQNLQEFLGKSSVALPSVLTERCVKHAYKLVDLYCLNHDTVCCDLCQDDYHRSCKDMILSIPEYVQNNESASMPEDFHARINTAITIMLEYQNELEHKRQCLLDKREKLLENIAQFRQEINAKLDYLQNKTAEEIDEKIRALTDELEEKIAELKQDIARMKSAEKSVETSCKNKYQIFVSGKIGAEIANKAECLGNDDGDLEKSEVPDFAGDQSILILLDEMNDMGIVRQLKAQDTDINNKTQKADVTYAHENSDNFNTQNPVIKGQIAENVLKNEQKDKKILQFQINGKITVCTKVDSDSKEIKSQGIVTCCFLKNGKIVLGDYDNKKLKMLHRSTYGVTNQFDLPGSPWQLCAINDNSIAVSLGTIREIQFFSLQYHIQKSSSFSTTHNCYGLAYANDNFFVSDSNTYIYVYNEFGVQLKQFTNNLLRSPSIMNSLLDICLESLAVSDDGTRIFVTHSSNGVIMLQNEGKDVKQYNGIQLQNAFGSHYLSENKGLLVCGMESNNVLLFGPDGEIIQQVLRWDGGHDYKLVCCNKERTKMIVCRAGTYYIDIYDLMNT